MTDSKPVAQGSIPCLGAKKEKCINYNAKNIGGDRYFNLFDFKNKKINNSDVYKIIFITIIRV